MFPEGYENLQDDKDIIEALVKLKTDHPEMKRCSYKNG
jgi:hypothetical protein